MSPGRKNKEKEADKSIPFIAITSFFFSFIFARLWVMLTGAAETTYQEGATYFGRNVIIKGIHVHHFFYGFVLMCIGGWLALNYKDRGRRRVAALFYGVGLGFFIDEVGFLLTWGEYWSSLTYAIFIGTGVVFLNVIYFADFWNEVRKNIISYSKEHLLLSKALRIPTFVEVVDRMSNKVSRTEKVSQIFSGLVYLGAGVAILIYPRLLYYWVAGGFILASVSHFVRVVKS